MCCCCFGCNCCIVPLVKRQREIKNDRQFLRMERMHQTHKHIQQVYTRFSFFFCLSVCLTVSLSRRIFHSFYIILFYFNFFQCLHFSAPFLSKIILIFKCGIFCFIPFSFVDIVFHAVCLKTKMIICVIEQKLNRNNSTGCSHSWKFRISWNDPELQTRGYW